MKKALILIIALIMVFMVVGCSANSSPEELAAQYCKALETGDGDNLIAIFDVQNNLYEENPEGFDNRAPIIIDDFYDEYVYSQYYTSYDDSPSRGRGSWDSELLQQEKFEENCTYYLFDKFYEGYTVEYKGFRIVEEDKNNSEYKQIINNSIEADLRIPALLVNFINEIESHAVVTFDIIIKSKDGTISEAYDTHMRVYKRGGKWYADAINSEVFDDLFDNTGQPCLFGGYALDSLAYYEAACEESE